MSHSYVRVYRAANRTEAYLLKGLLEQHGIGVRLLGENLSSGVGELPADVIEVEIQVTSGFEQLARELIAEYEQRATDDSENVWHCVACSESNPESFSVCWNCQTARPG